MSNDADQKTKWEKDSELTQEEKAILSFHRRIAQLELEIESLRAENAVLKVSNDLLSRTSRDDLKLLISKELIEAKTKLSAANAQMDKMVEALEFVSMPITSRNPTVEGLIETFTNDSLRAKEVLADYEEFKKDSK